MTSSGSPGSVNVRVSVPDQELDVLVLIVHYLRSLGLSTTAVALLRESGVDPFWLCGPSREVALLRESVLLGEWARVTALLRPLRIAVSQDSYTTAVSLVEKQALMEDFFSTVGDIEDNAKRRRLVLEKLLDEERDQAGRLTRAEVEICLRVLKSSAAPVSSVWSVDEARLNCFEKLVPLFRSEISAEDDESKYISMAPRRLAALLNDAMLLHQREEQRHDLDLISLTPISSDSLPNSSEDSSSLRLVEFGPSIHDAPHVNLCCSMDLTKLKIEDVKTRQWAEEARDISAVREFHTLKANPLVMSIDLCRIGRHGVNQSVTGRDNDPNLHEEQTLEDTLEKRENHSCGGAQLDVTTQTEHEVASSSSQTDVILSEVQAPNSSLTDVSQSARTDKCSSFHTQVDTFECSSMSIEGTLISADPPSETWFSSRIDQKPCVDVSSVGEMPFTATIGEQPMKTDEPEKDADELDDKMTASEWLEQSALPTENSSKGELQNSLHDSSDDDIRYGQGKFIQSYSKLTLDSIARACVSAEARDAQAIRAMDISPDGTEVVIGTNSRALRILDLVEPLSTALSHSASHGNFLPLLPVSMEKHKHHSSSIYATTYNLPGVGGSEAHHPLMVASGAADSSIKVFPRASPNEEVWIRSHAGKCRALQFVSPHLLCSAASGDLVIRCWDLEGASTTCIQRFDGHVGEIQALALDLTSQAGWIDSRCMVSSAMDRTVRLWDLRSAQCARVLVKTPSPAFTVAFQPQVTASAASVIATGHQDGSVSLWDLRYTKGGQRPLASVSHHRDECRAASWSPDGRWLLSASFDGTVCLLETSKMEPLAPVSSFHQHLDKILQALWHPSQPAIITTGADKFVKLWSFS